MLTGLEQIHMASGKMGQAVSSEVLYEVLQSRLGAFDHVACTKDNGHSASTFVMTFV